MTNETRYILPKFNCPYFFYFHGILAFLSICEERRDQWRWNRAEPQTPLDLKGVSVSCIPFSLDLPQGQRRVFCSSQTSLFLHLLPFLLKSVSHLLLCRSLVLYPTLTPLPKTLSVPLHRFLNFLLHRTSTNLLPIHQVAPLPLLNFLLYLLRNA